MKKCLILCMSCNQQFFKEEEKTILKTWASDIDKYPNLKLAIYSSSDDGKYHYNKTTHKILVPTEDDLYHTFDKTVETLNFIDYIDEFKDYDYILRTNCSTYFNLKLLVKILDSFEEDNVYCGITHCCLNSTAPFNWAPHPMGNCMILSKKLINVIKDPNSLKIAKEMNKTIDSDKAAYTIDDATIGSILNCYWIKNNEDPLMHYKQLGIYNIYKTITEHSIISLNALCYSLRLYHLNNEERYKQEIEFIYNFHDYVNVQLNDDISLIDNQIKNSLFTVLCPGGNKILTIDEMKDYYKNNNVYSNLYEVNKKNKNIIVFGGAGFIGSNLISTLISNANNKVLCVDNLLTGTLDNVNRYQLLKNYKFLNFDIVDFMNNNATNFFNEVETFLNNQIDEIYNFACPASPEKYQKDPIHTLMTSIAISQICKIAMSYNAKLLHSSTSEVYGEPNIPIQNEEYRGNVNMMGLRSCYDEGKRVAETFLYEFHKQGCCCKIIRIFNTYGKWMTKDDGRVISNFIWQALNNEPLTIYGDGAQTRSFQYIDDLICAIQKLMQTNDDVIGPYNIGNPEEYSINEIAQKVLEKLPNSTSKIIYKDLPIDDPTHRKPDITKAKNDLNWEPNISLDNGLDQTIEYFSKMMENKSRTHKTIYIYTHKDFTPIVGKDNYIILSETTISRKEHDIIDVNTLDNISKFELCYSELKGFYWVWKNIKYEDMPTFIGFNHYRRYFEFLDNIPEIEKDEVILQYPLQFQLNNNASISLKTQYAINHNIDDLLFCGEIIKDMYSDYYDTFNNIINDIDLYCNNLVIMHKDEFIKFMEWWFGILFEFDKRKGFSCYNDVKQYVDDRKKFYEKENQKINYQYRIQAFLSERLLTVYMKHNFKGKIRHYKSIITDFSNEFQK